MLLSAATVSDELAYSVSGMACDPCAIPVTREITQVDEAGYDAEQA